MHRQAGAPQSTSRMKVSVGHTPLPRRRGPRAAAAALAAARLPGARAAQPCPPAQGTPRPNFVVIQTDDQTLAELYATWLTPIGVEARVMPNTLDLIKKAGRDLQPLLRLLPALLPSRATLLSGRYAHSNGVISTTRPRGGWDGYKKKAIYKHNLGVWLQDAGYRTIHRQVPQPLRGEQVPPTPRSRPAGTTGRPTRRTSPSASITATC